MAAVRDFADELEGYAYLPRMFDKARAQLSGDTDAPPFGCPLDHSCMARLRVYPETVLELVSEKGDDDRTILGELRERGIPPATEVWFDARSTEDELLTGVYLKVRPRELLGELRPRPGQRVVAVEEGEALFFLGDRQMRIVRSGEVVRVPPELPHRIENISEAPLRLEWLRGDPGAVGEPVPFEVYEPGVYLHGTKADLAVGDLLVAGRESNFVAGRLMNYVYFTATLDAAVWGAELASGEGRGRIYVVEPLGEFEDDPNVTNKKFSGNPTQSFRSREPLRIVDELLDWVGHSPKKLEAMQARLDSLQQQGTGLIED